MRDGREELLERVEHLAALDDVLQSALSGPQGRIVLVAGEAGVGKTSLVRVFCAHQQGSRRRG
jgi:Cdc6-like AAA superfamily ATPase